MNVLQIAALLIVLAGAFGAINYLFLKLPPSIGILVVALFASLAVMGLDAVLPMLEITGAIREQVIAFLVEVRAVEGQVRTGASHGFGGRPKDVDVGHALLLGDLANGLGVKPDVLVVAVGVRRETNL